MRHDFIEDFGGAILDGTNDAEQHATGDAAPRAVLKPGLPFEGCIAFDLTWTEWPCGEAPALGFTPPSCSGEGKTPEDGFIFVEQNDLALTRPILQGGEFEMRKGQSSRGGIKPSGGATVAQRVFFKTQRTLSRPS
jgi:hypothetical protein